MENNSREDYSNKYSELINSQGFENKYNCLIEFDFNKTKIKPNKISREVYSYWLDAGYGIGVFDFLLDAHLFNRGDIIYTGYLEYLYYKGILERNIKEDFGVNDFQIVQKRFYYQEEIEDDNIITSPKPTIFYTIKPIIL